MRKVPSANALQVCAWGWPGWGVGCLHQLAAFKLRLECKASPTAAHATLLTSHRPSPPCPALQATFLLLFVNTCGFVISKPQIPGGWNGVYWANPMQVGAPAGFSSSGGLGCTVI